MKTLVTRHGIMPVNPLEKILFGRGILEDKLQAINEDSDRFYNECLVAEGETIERPKPKPTTKEQKTQAQESEAIDIVEKLDEKTLEPSELKKEYFSLLEKTPSVDLYELMLEKTKDLHPGINADIIKTFKSSIDVLRIQRYNKKLSKNLNKLYKIRDETTKFAKMFGEITQRQLKDMGADAKLRENQYVFQVNYEKMKEDFTTRKTTLKTLLESPASIERFIETYKEADEIMKLFDAFHLNDVQEGATYIELDTNVLKKELALAAKNKSFADELNEITGEIDTIKYETLQGIGIKEGGGSKSINDLEKLGIFNKDQIKQLMKNPQNNKGLSEIQQNIKNIILGGSLEEIEQDHIIKYVPKARGSKFCKDKKEAISATGKRHLILNPNKDLDELRREIMEHVLNKIV